ncbi:hypothetical protein JCM11491_003827 [Sporobolomyces phaffii]
MKIHMTEAAAGQNVDYLSRLPPELLQIIFDQVQSSSQPVLAPLSRHLLPFIQKPLFRSLHLESDPYAALDFLCQTVDSHRHLALFIRSLDIDIALEYARKEHHEVRDAHAPLNTLIKALFERLINLERLFVTGSSRVASIVLEPVVAALSFPKLSSLHLASTFEHLPDPFHFSNFESLKYYPELSTFSLVVCRSSKSIHPPAKPQIKPPVMNTQIRKFALGGPLSSSSTSVTNLLASFESLSAVSLHDSSKQSQLYDLVGAIPNPSHVRALYLNHEERDGRPPKESLENQLERFNMVSSLLIGGTCSTFSPSFYLALARLPHLKHLKFPEAARVSLAQLEKLVDSGSPIKSKSLESITFDNVEGEIGTLVKDAGEPYWDCDAEEWRVHPDWIAPNWTDEFSEEGLVEFLKAAKREGIQVGGSAVDAIGIQDAFLNELNVVDNWDAD